MGIKLTREGPTLNPGHECRHNWTLKVTAESDEEGLSSKIFVYHAVHEDDPLNGDTFSNVASLQDMNIIPEDAPMSIPAEDGREDNVPWYRTDEVVFDCYNMRDVEHIWKTIQIDVKNLLKEYRISRNLQEQEVVIYE